MKRLLLILLLLPCVAGAADWCSSFDEFGTMARRKLGIDTSNTTYVTDSTLNQLVREGAVFIPNALRCIPLTKTFVTAYKDDAYDLDSLFLGVKSLRWHKNDSTKTLIYMPREQWVNLEVQTTEGKDGLAKQPSYYDYDEDEIVLHPAPTRVNDTFYIHGWRKVSNIAAKDSVGIIVEQQYRPAILNYVVYQVAKAKQHPLVEMFRQDYIDVMNVLGAGRASEKGSD